LHNSKKGIILFGGIEIEAKVTAVWKRAVDASRIQKVVASILAVAIVIALMGYLNQHGILYLEETLYNLLRDFYANISSELADIAITVLIIDAQYQRSEINREKRDLILQLGSPDNAFAREALRKIRARRWLNDWSLNFASLIYANLRGACLMYANLMRANLGGADLRDTDLEGANLDNANLINTKITDTQLD